MSELLSADGKKSVAHPELEDTVHQWFNWLYEVKKKDEEKRKEEEHHKLVSRIVACVEGGTGFLHTVTKPTAWRG